MRIFSASNSLAFFLGLSEFGLTNQFFFGLHFGRGDLDLFQTFSCGDFFGVLDPFLLFDHGTFDGDPFANHFLDVSFFDFDRLLFLDLGDTDHTQSFGHFQIAVAVDTFQFDRVGLFFVPLSDQDLTRLVFFGDSKFFFGRDPCAFGFQSLFFLDLLCGGLFASGDFGDFTSLFFDRFDALTFQGQDRFFRFDVLLLERLFFVARELVFFDLFVRGQFGDLLDALGVQNIGRAEHAQRRLFEVVDRRVVQSVTVQVGADHFQDFVLELVALVVQVDEIELLTDGF